MPSQQDRANLPALRLHRHLGILTRANGTLNFGGKPGKTSKPLPSFHKSEAWKYFMKTFKADCKGTANVARYRTQLAFGVRTARSKKRCGPKRSPVAARLPVRRGRGHCGSEGEAPSARAHSRTASSRVVRGGGRKHGCGANFEER